MVGMVRLQVIAPVGIAPRRATILSPIQLPVDVHDGGCQEAKGMRIARIRSVLSTMDRQSPVIRLGRIFQRRGWGRYLHAAAYRRRLSNGRCGARLSFCMASRFHFPLYVFQGADNSGVVFMELGGVRHLLLFTSAENASIYREMQSLTAQMRRLKTATELRDLLTAQIDAEEIKIAVDPTGDAIRGLGDWANVGDGRF